MYIVWQAVVLGGSQSTPAGGGSAAGPPTKEQIFASIHASTGVVLPLFGLLALVTSLLGVGLGCVDFMEDALFGGGSTNGEDGSPTGTPAEGLAATESTGGAAKTRPRPVNHIDKIV